MVRSWCQADAARAVEFGLTFYTSATEDLGFHLATVLIICISSAVLQLATFTLPTSYVIVIAH